MHVAFQIYEICIDLVFTHFICPAVVNPEPYGITDVPIGYIARFNLMQVAQILQMLAVRKYQEVDAKVADLYNKFHTVSHNLYFKPANNLFYFFMKLFISLI